jgi:hypothetical protein
MTMKLHPEVRFTRDILPLNDVPTHKEYQEWLEKADTGDDRQRTRQEYADKFSRFVRSCVEGTVVCESVDQELPNHDITSN